MKMELIKMINLLNKFNFIIIENNEEKIIVKKEGNDKNEES